MPYANYPEGNGLGNSGVTAGSYTNSSITVNAQGLVTAASSGSTGAAPMQLIYSGLNGANIAQFTMGPSSENTMAYPAYGGNSPIGNPDLELVCNTTGGTITVRWRFQHGGITSVGASVLTPRKRAANGGAWSSGSTVALTAAAQIATGTMSLADGESFGLHVTLDGTPTFTGPVLFWAG